MKALCVQAKLGRCNFSGCKSIHVQEVSHDVFNMNILGKYFAVCDDFNNEIQFFVPDSFTEKECRKLLFELTLKLKYIRKEEDT